MSYRKNTAGQKFNVLAISTATGLPVTGDAANITAQISLDAGTFAAVTDTNPTELDATNAPGVYVFDLSQSETNGDVLTIVPSSTTANVQLDMLNIYTHDLSDYKAQPSEIYTHFTTGTNEDVFKADVSPISTDIGTINTNVSAIKTKTDQFVFSVANQVDSNAISGGTSPTEIYTHFTTGSNADAFKATTLIGGGSSAITLTVTDGTNPIEGVAVWISTDSAGSNVVAGALDTNAFGQVSFTLDPGTYYQWNQLGGYNFTNPTTITVS